MKAFTVRLPNALAEELQTRAHQSKTRLPNYLSQLLECIAADLRRPIRIRAFDVMDRRDEGEFPVRAKL